MKKIIFSIFNDNVDQNHKSTNNFKLSQFRKHAPELERVQQQYAEQVGADYVLHRSSTTDYNKLQFEKIIQFEKYAYEYDAVLYLDFDIIINNGAPNIFNKIDLNTIGAHPLERLKLNKDFRTQENQRLRSFLKNDNFDRQNVFCKTCAKNAMLLLDGIYGTSKLYNTGVVIGGSEVIKSLNFAERIESLNTLLDEASDDCIYPLEISRQFYHNNEVYITYLIEKHNIPYTDLGIQWNFILDNVIQAYPVDSAYFIHHVNKEFERSFDPTWYNKFAVPFPDA